MNDVNATVAPLVSRRGPVPTLANSVSPQPATSVPAAWQAVYTAAAYAVVERLRRDLWLARLQPSLN